MAKKKNFIRVKKEDGAYGYVLTNPNSRASEFNADKGMFKIHDLPNEKSHFTWGWNVPEVAPTSKNVYNGGDIGEITVTAKVPEKKFIQADNMFYPTDEMIRKRLIMDDLEMAAGNLMTGGYASIAKSGAEDVRNGNYLTGAAQFALPFPFLRAPGAFIKAATAAYATDRISNDAWARTFGRGNTLAQDISNVTGISEPDAHFFNPVTVWGAKIGINSHLWRPSGRLGMNLIPDIPKGYTFVRNLELRTKDGVRKVTLIKNNETLKYAILEDLGKDSAPKVNLVDLRNYKGEKLTGNEEGFDQWALRQTPETDHFANLSHGLNNEKLLPIMNREFEALPNGSRVDLGEIFSSDSSSNLLLYVRRNNKRIKMVLPKNPDEMTVSNNYGTRGIESERIFNELLDKLLDIYGYSPSAVPRAVYNPSTNTLTVPKLSFIKLFKKGNKIYNKTLLRK